jgi:hypothetical protein
MYIRGPNATTRIFALMLVDRIVHVSYATNTAWVKALMQTGAEWEAVMCGQFILLNGDSSIILRFKRRVMAVESGVASINLFPEDFVGKEPMTRVDTASWTNFDCDADVVARVAGNGGSYGGADNDGGSYGGADNENGWGDVEPEARASLGGWEDEEEQDEDEEDDEEEEDEERGDDEGYYDDEDENEGEVEDE